MSVTIYQVDAFSSKPFGGNPAGVCILEKLAADNWMQNVASEMALSETAFLVRGNGAYHLRWFTPAAEVDLCGHATLASAHVLVETGREKRGRQILFNTASGTLSAKVNDEKVFLDFPSEPARPIEPSAKLQAAVGQKIVAAGRNRLDYLVEVESEDALASFVPDSSAISALDVRGLILTAGSTTEFDFVSRYFAPRFGILEDPVTGSTHCCLTPYWSAKLGKDSLRARQLSSRGGTLDVAMVGDRVSIGGNAVTTMTCELHV